MTNSCLEVTSRLGQAVWMRVKCTDQRIYDHQCLSILVLLFNLYIVSVDPIVLSIQLSSSRLYFIFVPIDHLASPTPHLR
jgi:hypothetical protein